MEENDMRQALLAELIDSMHGRLADKMFPPDPSKADQPAATGIPGTEAAADEKMIDKDNDAEDMSDEDLDEMMKSIG
jgi:hypothetical protein